jgi:hypothetical protein
MAAADACALTTHALQVGRCWVPAPAGQLARYDPAPLLAASGLRLGSLGTDYYALLQVRGEGGGGGEGGRQGGREGGGGGGEGPNTSSGMMTTGITGSAWSSCGLCLLCAAAGGRGGAGWRVQVVCVWWAGGIGTLTSCVGRARGKQAAVAASRHLHLHSRCRGADAAACLAPNTSSRHVTVVGIVGPVTTADPRLPLDIPLPTPPLDLPLPTTTTPCLSLAAA